MKSLPAAPVGSNSVLGHCVTHNASTTDARGAAVSQVANKQHAGSLICSEWTCDCDSALLRIVSLKVCFASDPVMMSLYPQKHVLPHFDKTVQLILLWIQCDLRSTFAHKLLIPGTLEQWINQQREYFCLQIKEKSKTWPLFFLFLPHSEQQKQNLLHKCPRNVSDVPEAFCGLISKNKPSMLLWVVYGAGKWCKRIWVLQP